MVVKIVSVFTNTKETGSNFLTGHGQSFLIKTKNEMLLFDTGVDNKILLNLELLKTPINSIDVIILSHGHYDHTKGLVHLLKGRERQFTIIGHPNIFEKKAVKTKNRLSLTIRRDIGFPKLTKKQKKLISFNLQTEAFEIIPKIWTTGQVEERKYKDGTEERLLHKVGRKWEKDPLLDDLSLVIDGDEGLIILCGCCHAGLLNTLVKVRKQFKNKKIHTIIGGTHMITYRKKELDELAEKLKHEYNNPFLKLNHCTGNIALDYFKDKLGIEKVTEFHTGMEVEFKL